MDGCCGSEDSPRAGQPKVIVRWLAVVLALAGWYVSLQLLRVSAGSTATNPFLQAMCGESGEEGSPNDCTSVLTAPQAYIKLSDKPGAPRIPSAALGMAYFACVALWYLFVGPPSRSGRNWHLLIGLVVLLGTWQSLGYIRVMAGELHRWCGGCLVAHGLNAGLLVLTALAYPWRASTEPGARHPTTRLALASATAGLLAAVTHLALVLMFLFGSILAERTSRYEEVLGDPAFILWDFNRQSTAAIPLYGDELAETEPAAQHTVVVFSDFQCPACRDAHQALAAVLKKYGDRLRVLYRYYPQDPECNPYPSYRTGGHASACRAAWAAEAVGRIAGRETYLRMRDLLFARQHELPSTPYARQSEQQRGLLADWAAELGVDRAALLEALDSPNVRQRIESDIAAAEELGIHAMPAVYVDGKRLVNWSKPAVWDAILRTDSTASRPTGAAEPR